ncbi:MAG: IS30 family transposase [Treponema sp.]|nr:IS30 family transposase [Treponema sp.]
MQYLPQGCKQRHKRRSCKQRRVGKIPKRTPLAERPASVETREEIGHWEADTVVSRQSKIAVAVFVERKTRTFIVICIPDKSAESMRQAAIQALGSFPPSLRKTITLDNGTENALHEGIAAELGMQSYFCEPYHRWEQGSIENRNGILRRYFPKKFDWALTHQKEIDIVVSKINATPMKCLGFKMPTEVFANYTSVALRD